MNQLEFLSSKLPHECTLEEYAGPEPAEYCWTREKRIARHKWEDQRDQHHALVCVALEQSQQVPGAVLADYPWLADTTDCSRWKRRIPPQWEVAS